MKIVFFGTPLFAAKHLERLILEKIDVVAIVTKPDKPQGRSQKLQPTDVKVLAQKLIPHIPLFQPEKCSTPEFIEILKGFQADLYVVVAYGEIIKQAVLDLPPLGCINVHASALPRYRGAAPMQRALMNGELETGISVIQLVLKMDAGDVLYEEKMKIPQNMTLPELEEALCEMGCRCLLKVLRDFEKGTTVKTPQDHALATFAAKVTPEECLIDWTKPSLEIHNLVRGVTPHPGAWCTIFVRDQKKRLKILRSECDPEAKGVPGTCFQKTKEGLEVYCGQGALILKELQLEGKQAMKTADLLRGIPFNTIRFIS